MTTVVTNGKVMYADLKATHTNPMEFECDSCGSTGTMSKENAQKIVMLNGGAIKRKVGGDTAAFMGCAGDSNIGNFLEAIWPVGSDLNHIVESYDALNLTKNNVPRGTVLIVTETNRVFRFAVVTRRKMLTIREVPEKELPIAIGSGATYFEAYLKTFKIGWLDAFRMTIHFDPYSSERYSAAGWSPDKQTGEPKLKHRQKIHNSRPIADVLRIAQRNMRLK